MTINDIITNALTEIGVVAPGEPLSGPEGAFALAKANELFDLWAADRRFVFATFFELFTLVPGLSPHTIGQAAIITATSLTANVATYTAANSFTAGQSVTVVGTSNTGGIFNVVAQQVVSATPTQFTIALVHANVANAADTGNAVISSQANPTFATSGQRPIRIESGSVLLVSGSTTVDVPINTKRDAAWWAEQRVKSLQVNYPTDAFYEQDWPNGAIFFWPVPKTTYQVRLELWTALGQFASLATTFSLPPGWQNMLTLALAEHLAGPFGTQAPASLVQRAAKARETVLRGNPTTKSPRVTIADAGMPTGTKRGGFNYYTGR